VVVVVVVVLVVIVVIVVPHYITINPENISKPVSVLESELFFPTV